MRFHLVVLVFITVLVGSTDALAQYRYELDLAKRTTGETTLPVPPGAVSVVVKNRIPGRLYFYSVTREWVPIPPVPLPAGVVIPAGAAGPSADCLALTAAFQAITEPADETEVPSKAKAFTDLMAGELFQKCTDETFRRPIREAVDVLRATELIGPVGVSPGEQLRVTVQRIAADGTVEKTWTTILTTGARGEWLTTFGVTFVPRNDKRYFAAPATEANKFVITPEAPTEKREVSYLPTVLFSWMPTSQRGKYVVWSPTAGVGATSNTFAAVLGLTATFNTNLGITGGVAFTNQKRLLGKYSEKQVVSENLSEAQLHREAKLPSAFLSVTFRFGQSPFASPPAAPAPPPPSAAGSPVTPAAAPPAPGAAGGGGSKPPAAGTPPAGGALPVGNAPAPGAVPPPPGN